jgi:hypothetical protein
VLTTSWSASIHVGGLSQSHTSITLTSHEHNRIKRCGEQQACTDVQHGDSDMHGLGSRASISRRELAQTCANDSRPSQPVCSVFSVGSRLGQHAHKANDRHPPHARTLPTDGNPIIATRASPVLTTSKPSPFGLRDHAVTPRNTRREARRGRT